jgi:hypothetical protein
MSVPMTRPEYSAAAAYAGEWLKEPWPELRPLRKLTGLACGIYILCYRNPLSGRPTVAYVGKADRRISGGDISDRWREHLKTPKARLVRWGTVIPLRQDTPAGEVTRIEGDVARYFGVPPLCRAVPHRPAA